MERLSDGRNALPRRRRAWGCCRIAVRWGPGIVGTPTSVRYTVRPAPAVLLAARVPAGRPALRASLPAALGGPVIEGRKPCLASLVVMGSATSASSKGDVTGGYSSEAACVR